MKIHTRKHWLLLAGICAAGSAWAGLTGQPTGRYYFGDGEGVNCTLRLDARGRFEFKWQCCVGACDSNTGPFHFRNGVVILSPRKRNVRRGLSGTPTRFLVVNWGPRRYLVPQEDVRDFCNAVNQGSEPRTHVWGQYYLRVGDEKKAAGGDPDLPAKWKPLLIAKKDRVKPPRFDPKERLPNATDFRSLKPDRAKPGAKRSSPRQ